MKKRAFFRKAMILLAAFALLLIYRPGAGFLPGARAEEAGEKDISGLGTGVIANPGTGTGMWNKVYFGSAGAPVVFNVLANYTTDFGSADKPTMLLDSAANYLMKAFDDEDNYTNEWDNSTLRTWLNGAFLDSAFTAAEKAAIAASRKAAKAQGDGSGWSALNYTPLTGEKVFLLDAAEATNTSFGFADQESATETRRKAGGYGYWWLRSPLDDTDFGTGSVYDTGALAYDSVAREDVGVSPVLNVSLGSVLFSERVAGGFKLTVTDSGIAVAVNRDGIRQEEREITVPYTLSGERAGSVSRISVVMTDAEWNDNSGWGRGADLKYYGKLDGTISAGAETTGTFTLPDDYDPGWRTYLIAETENEGAVTNYGSTPAVMAAHEHSWTYAAEGNTITATCGHVGCDITAGLTMTVSATGKDMLTYDGIDKPASLNDDYDEVAFPGEYTIRYTGTGDTEYESTEAPAAAGTYKAGVSEGDAAASVSFEIERREVTAAVTALNRDYIPGDVSVELTAGEVVNAVDGDDVRTDISGARGTMQDANAGEDRPVAVEGVKLAGEKAANYLLTGQPEGVTVTIHQIPEPAEITDEAEVIRGGNTLDLSTLVKGAFGEITYAFDGETNGCRLKGSELTTGNDAGSCEVTVTIADSTNYTGKKANILVTITEKKDGKLSVKQGGTVYGSEPAEPEYTRPEKPVAEPIIQYSGTTSGGNEYGPDSRKPAEAGEYTVSVTEETIDTIYTGSADFTIARAESSVTEAPTANGWTYDGEEKPLLSEKGAAAGGILRYALGADSKTAPTEGWSTEPPAAKDAGSYHIWSMVAGDDNHNDTEPTCLTAKVGRKSIADAVVTLSATQLTYTGKKLSVRVTGVAAGDMKLAADDYEVSGATGGTEIDSYTLTVTGVGNFTGTAEAGWAIVEKAMDVSAENVHVTYDGKAHGITVNVTDPAKDSTVTYGKKEGTYSLTECPTITNAGTLAVYYKVSAEHYADYTGVATVTVEKADAEVTTTPKAAKGLVYNGKAQALVTAGAAAGGEMQYALGTGAKTAPADGWSAEIPEGKDAGSYYVWSKADGDKNHNDTEPGCITVKIAQKSIAEATVQLSATQLTYTGEKHSVDVTGVETDGIQLTADDYEISGATSGTKIAGYTLTVTGKGNFTDAAEASWAIVKKAMAVQAEDVSAVYDGEAHGITVHVTDPADGFTILYGTKEGTYSLTDAPTLTDAGETTVFYKVSAEHYSDYTGKAKVTVTKAESKVTTAAKAAKGLTYNGGAQALVSAGEAEGGGMQYAAGTDSKTAPADGWSAEIPEGTGAGSYYVWSKAAGDGNHKDTKPACVTVKIAQRSITDAVVTLSATQMSYNGKKQSVSIREATAGGIPLTTADYTVSGETSGTGKGDYTLTLTGKGNFTGETTASWTIVEKAMTVSAESVSVPYDGKEHGITVQVTDPAEGFTITYGTMEGVCEQEEIPTLTDAGTLAVYYRVSAANYTDYTGVATVTVSKTDAKVTTAAKAAKGLTYNGSAQQLATAGAAKGGEMQYALGTDSKTAPAEGWNADIPEAADAGTYYIWSKAAGGRNHNDSEPACVTAKIAKKSIAKATVTLSAAQLTYSGKKQHVRVTGIAADGLTLTADDYTVSGATAGTAKGDYTVTVTGKGNFTDAAEASWKIVEKAMTVSARNVLVTRDGKAHGITVQVTDPAEGFTVRYGKTEGIYDLKTSPMLKETGTLAVYYRVTAENYDDYTGVATVTVVKPEPTAATVVSAPIPMNGIFAIGEPQALVIAGEAEGGEMRYALGTDEKTVPEDGWSARIPTGTDAGTYYVWYKAAGDEDHSDSEAKALKVVMKPQFGTADFILPGAVTKIGESAFEGAGMTIAYVPDKCTAIGDYAFRNCAELTQIRLPKDCDISDTAFEGCEGLEWIFSLPGGSTEAWAEAHGIPFVQEPYVVFPE